MAWEDILADSNFQAESEDVKVNVAKNYFDQNIGSNTDFLAEASDVQEKVRSNFMATVQPSEPIVGRGVGAPRLRPRPEEAAGRMTVPGAPEERNVFETVGAGLRRGTVGGGVGLGRGIRYVGEVIGSETVSELGEDLAEYSQGVLAAHPDWAPAKEQAGRSWYHPERLAETVAETIPMMAGVMVATVAATKAGIAAGVAAGTARIAGAIIGGSPFGIVSAGQMYDKAREEGVDDSTAKWLAGTSGVLEVGLEIFGANKVLKMMGFDDLGKEGLKQAVTRTELIKNIARGAGEMSKVEALEEFSQTIKDNLIVKFGIDEGQEIFEGGLQSAVIGGIMGGLMGGGAQVFADFTAVPGAPEKAELPEVQALPKEVAERIVADQTIPAKRAQDIAAVLVPEIETQITPEKSAEESAMIMEELLEAAGVTMTAEEVEAVRTPIVEEPVDPVAAVAETVKTKLTETLDTIEPTSEMGAQVKEMLQAEVARVTAEVALPEAEIIPEVAAEPVTPKVIDTYVAEGLAHAKTDVTSQEVNVREQAIREEVGEEAADEYRISFNNEKIRQAKEKAKPGKVELDETLVNLLEPVRAELRERVEAKPELATDWILGKGGISTKDKLASEVKRIASIKEAGINLVRSEEKGGQPLDRLLGMAMDEGLMPADSTLNDFIAAIEEDVNLLKGGWKEQQKELKVLDRALDKTRALGKSEKAIFDKIVEEQSAIEKPAAAPEEVFELAPTPAAAVPGPVEEQLGLPIAKGQAEMPAAGLAAREAEGLEIIERPREIAAEKAQEKLFEKPATLTPETVPDGIQVTTKAIVEETGDVIDYIQPAKEALAETTDQLDKYKALLDCLKGR
ncbi:hypothetical protein KAR91_77760 [Candidatus Pacearchaeota archaeon]|nr:hypothetical protein [Candidatus Pacearchaeota archaeon]